MSPRRPPQLETLPGMEPAGWAPVAEAGHGLTAEQEQAVARRAEPLLVSAAAGSGKTSVLVERFVRAVREDRVAPGRILAITFTERAAGELRERVRARLLELGERGAARDTEAAFVGTFHGFCARLLRAGPVAAGLDPDFAVLDEGQSGRLRAGAFERAVRGFLAERREPAVDLLAAYGVDRLRAMLEQAYLELRSRGARLPRLPHPVGEPATGGAGATAEAEQVLVLLDDLLQRFGACNEALKRERAALDFDDLELLAKELLLGREAVREAWAQSFELLMVDEFQDTNPRQLAILQALDRDNLFTVGDELQSIYGFRHADVGLFRARRGALQEHGRVLSLSSNFRSRRELVAAINAVFAERFADLRPLVPGRQAGVAAGAQAQPAADEEPAVELLLTDTAGWEAHEELARRIADGLPAAQLWRQAEARMLAARVAALVRQGRARPGEIAVLMRATGDLEVFERALQLEGLRTLAAVGAFWGHQQIRDLEAYLRALANPLEEQALYGVLASPLGGCSRDCLALLSTAARRGRIGLWEAAQAAVDDGESLEIAAGQAIAAAEAAAEPEPAIAEPLARLSPRDRAALGRVVALLRRERAAAPRHTIAELLERAIEASGYRRRVLALEWGERRLANVHKLLRLAREFETREGRDLRAFLDYVDYLRQAARVEPDAPVEGTEPDAVRLMTVHAAKGLEFPVVCVADLGRQPNARTPDLIAEGERVGFRLMRVQDGDSQPALDYEQLCAERREREAEEEDRIMYVAMTRARELLLLSGAANFARWPRIGPGGAPVSWLGPAICEGLPAMLAAGEEPPEVATPGSAGAAGAEGAEGAEGVGDMARVRLRLNTPLAPAFGEPPAPVPAPVPAPGPAGPVQAADPPDPPRAAAEPPAPTRPAAEEPGPAEPAAEPPDPATAAMAHISTFSYSSLTELERCGYRYYLERVLRLPEDRAAARTAAAPPGADEAGARPEELDPRARGTLVHRLMELLDFSDPRPPTPEQVGEHARELGIRVKAGEREELAALVAASCGAEPAARVAAASLIGREHPFAFALAPEEPLINGVIDLLARERDGTTLVLDYKSNRVPAGTGAGELEELVEREYAVQRLLYALAVLRDGAQAVEVVHWFLEPNAWVSVRFGAADRLVLEERLARRLAAAREGRFAVSERPHRALCLTCPGRGSLCSWEETETLREHP